MSNDERLLTWKELKALGWPHSPAETHRRIAKGRFPKPLRFPIGSGYPPSWRYRDVLPHLQKPYLSAR